MRVLILATVTESGGRRSGKGPEEHPGNSRAATSRYCRTSRWAEGPMAPAIKRSSTSRSSRSCPGPSLRLASGSPRFRHHQRQGSWPRPACSTVADRESRAAPGLGAIDPVLQAKAATTTLSRSSSARRSRRRPGRDHFRRHRPAGHPKVKDVGRIRGSRYARRLPQSLSPTGIPTDGCCCSRPRTARMPTSTTSTHACRACQPGPAGTDSQRPARGSGGPDVRLSRLLRRLRPGNPSGQVLRRRDVDGYFVYDVTVRKRPS